MTDNPAAERSALVRIEMVAAELATGHSANRVDKVGPVEILEAVLIGIVRIGPTIEIVGGRILPTFLVTCIL